MVGVLREGADQLLGTLPRAAHGLQDKRGNVDVWVPIKLDLLGPLGHVTRAGTACSNEAWAGRERDNSGDICVRGGAVLIKRKVQAGMLDLVAHHTGEAWHGLLSVFHGVTLRLNDISKASGHCSVPAINTAAVPTPRSSVTGGDPLLCHRMGQAEATREGSGAAGCGSMSLLAMDTRNQRSSAS